MTKLVAQLGAVIIVVGVEPQVTNSAAVFGGELLIIVVGVEHLVTVPQCLVGSILRPRERARYGWDAAFRWHMTISQAMTWDAQSIRHSGDYSCSGAHTDAPLSRDGVTLFHEWKINILLSVGMKIPFINCILCNQLMRRQMLETCIMINVV